MKLSTRVGLLLLVLLVCASGTRNQPSDRRDGNWWIEQDETMKLCYMIGFFDGIELGNNFSYWGYVKEVSAICQATPLPECAPAFRFL
jgi:hypothetical protein